MSNVTALNASKIELWSEFLQKTLIDESSWFAIAFLVSMLVIFFASIVGNLLTCIVIYSDRSMHTATNFYLFNLAISDLFVTFAMILELHEHFSEEFKLAGNNASCKIHYFLVVALWNNSILIMTALSIERYIAIWHPLLLNSTPVWKRVMKIIILIWIVAILETLPEVWTVKLVKTKKFSICSTIPSDYARILNGVLAVLTFLVPLSIMIFVYAMIAFKVNVNGTEREKSRDKIFNHRDNRSKVNKLIESAVSGCGRPKTALLVGWLVSLMVVVCSVAMTLSFLVCWLPFFTMRVLIFAYDARSLMQFKKWWGHFYRLCAFNGWFSIVLNPLLFSLMSTKFRQALKKLWRVKFKKATNLPT